ncbi:hypothetical protein PUNSTDRAFT_72005 [Punctularia strigosozonata HHB-11173 SS5]|uniref:uncharacterized protein n=1 Tax=Punctularia strigosozonata (strain HHB-11173) TaxID=741275 RepID=UPI00044171C9|nr:uncharacterized protein PUNSTDRAFT_72005 [Punctularia strigosozonata HHB-11173 SS5]EIN06662.1 hypothetical protein PUNSTDRAFT_72005 [Punctularia strigosozonata HHB-11173 SS5]
MPSTNLRALGIALLTALPLASAYTCSAGTYSPTGSSPCSFCPQGTYTSKTGATSCKAAQAGWFAAGPGATSQTICPSGYYSATSASASCTICPAGTYCNGQGRTSPQSCQPGRYSASPGATQDCANCPKGTFNNVYGATSCCTCCAGWYTDQTGQTHCFNCPNEGSFQQGYSSPGATDKSQCSAKSGALSSCTQDSTTGACRKFRSSPSGNAQRRHVVPRHCPPGTKACPTYAKGALGGYECVNTHTSLEQCGGCVAAGESLDGVRSADGGRDCSTIPQAEDVSCYRGECHIKTCKEGYTVSSDGERCVAVTVVGNRGRDGHRRHRKSHGL